MLAMKARERMTTTKGSLWTGNEGTSRESKKERKGRKGGQLQPAKRARSPSLPSQPPLVADPRFSTSLKVPRREYSHLESSLAIRSVQPEHGLTASSDGRRTSLLDSSSTGSSTSVSSFE